MNSDQMEQFINGLGMLTEIWTITYQGFLHQGLNPVDAMTHTKAFMSVTIDSIIEAGNSRTKEDKK